MNPTLSAAEVDRGGTPRGLIQICRRYRIYWLNADGCNGGEMHKQLMTVFVILLFEGLSFSQTQDQKSPSFVFGGKQLCVGMSESDAVTALAECCKLSPPAEDELEKRPSPEGMLLGRFVLSKEAEPQILGTISFLAEKWCASPARLRSRLIHRTMI